MEILQDDPDLVTANSFDKVSDTLVPRSPSQQQTWERPAPSSSPPSPSLVVDSSPSSTSLPAAQPAQDDASNQSASSTEELGPGTPAPPPLPPLRLVDLLFTASATTLSDVFAAASVLRRTHSMTIDLQTLQAILYCMHAARCHLAQQARERILSGRLIGDDDAAIVDAVLRHFDYITDEQTSF